MCPLQIRGQAAVPIVERAPEAEKCLTEKHERSLVTHSHVCQVTVFFNSVHAHDDDLNHIDAVIPGNTVDYIKCFRAP